MSKRIVSATLFVVFSMLQACSPLVQEHDGHDAGTNVKEILFSISEVSPTKSSISPQEGLIENVAVYAYKDGLLEDFVRSDGAEALTMKLAVGETYDLYCIANMDEYPEIADEEDFVRHGVRIDVESMCDALPMSKSLTVTVGENMREISLELSRLVARIDLVVDKGLLDYMEVVSVRLCQSAQVVRPFLKDGSRALDETEVFTGDYASGNDIKALNSGGSIHLYALENCQGILLPSNDDPWQKVPENIREDVAGCCTYLEMKCRFPDSDEYGVYCGDVIYRFFLGNDTSSDFNLRRNSRQNISMFATEDGLGRISWRVDASNLVFQGGDVSGIFIENFHTADNLYVTEYAFFELEMDEQADDYWSDNVFELKGLSKDGEELMNFEDLQYQGDGYYTCIGRALKPGDFDVWLVNANGNKVLRVFEGGYIQLPRVVIGMGESFSGYDVVESLDEDVECFINKDDFPVFVYLTDDDGYNINQCAGCDCRMLDWHVALTGNGCFIPDGCIVCGDVRYGTPADDSYVAMIPLKIVNDGQSEDVSRSLCEALGRGNLSLTVSERDFSMSDSHAASLYAEDIVFELGTSCQVVNTSKLPFKVGGWKLFSAKDAGVSSYYDAAVQAVTGNVGCRSLFSQGMDQWSGIYPLYLSGIPEIVCSWEDTYVIRDPGVTDVLLKSMVEADRRRLPDGGYQYRTVKEKYMMLSAEMLYECSCPPKIEIRTADGLGTIVPMVKQLSEEPITVEMYFNENHQLVAVSSEPVTLSIEVYGTLNSHIRTVSGHDLIIGSFDIRYYKHTDEFSSGVHQVHLSDTPVVVDASAVKDVLEYIRTIEYYSKYDGISAREVLKPYSMTLGVDIVPSSEKPVSVSFPERLLYRYENINYLYGEPPSTFNHRSNDVPDAEAFVDDDVSLVFDVTTRVLPELNLVTRL